MAQIDPVRFLVPDAFTKQFSRRAFFGGATAIGATALLAACAPSSGSGSPGALSIYTWGEYDDPAVIEKFTKDGGAVITLDSYSSNPELISKLAAARGTSGYDICVPTHSAIQQMVENDLLTELDHSKLPNMKNLSAAVLDTPFDPGNAYSVCKDWGSTGYVYDSTIIQRDLTSWADFWDAAQNEASGSFSLLEDQGEVSYAYFLANGIPMNTVDKGDFDAYREFILTIAPHVQIFESYVSNIVSQSGRALAHCWNGDARLGILQNEDPERYKWVWPTEGANLWQDNWAIVKGAPHEDAAYDFINYVLDPAVSLKELAYIGYNTGVDGVEDAATEAGVERPDMIFIDDAIMSKLEYSQLTEMNETTIAIFDELKAAAGK